MKRRSPPTTMLRPAINGQDNALSLVTVNLTLGLTNKTAKSTLNSTPNCFSTSILTITDYIWPYKLRPGGHQTNIATPQRAPETKREIHRPKRNIGKRMRAKTHVIKRRMRMLNLGLEIKATNKVMKVQPIKPR